MVKSSRNINKIFIALIVVFLFSASVSAAVTSGSTKQYGLGSHDFESDIVGSTQYKDSDPTIYRAYRFLDNQGKHTSVTVASQESGNKYLQFKDNGAPTRRYAYDPYWQIITNKSPEYDSGYFVESFSTATYDFFVFDFALAADAYVYSYTSESAGDNATMDLTQIPADAQNAIKKPAYPEGLRLVNEICALESNGQEEYETLYNSIKLVSDGSDWYLYAEQNGTYVNTGAKLKDKILEWNHFTVVVEINRENGNVANSKQHTYLNGDLVATQLITNESQYLADFSNYGYRIEYPADVANDNGYLYSFGIDNFNINYYMRGDDGSAYSSEGFGLDDYFKDGDIDKGIYNCEDIVYDNYYVANNPVANVGGKDYYSMNAALSAVEEGTTLKLFRSLENYTPSVDRMTVQADASLKFSLSSDAVGYSIVKTTENGVDTYILTHAGAESGGSGGSGEEDEPETDNLLRDTVFDGAKYNLTTTTSFIGNFYVKIPSEDSNYEIYTGEGSGYQGITYIEGVPHYKFTSKPLINDITAQITFNINVTVDGVTKALVAEYTIDEYFAEAMAWLTEMTEPTEYQIAQMQLIMNATRYANELYKYVQESEDGYSKYTEIISNEIYSKYLTSYSDLGTAENDDSDFSEISSVVVSAGLAVHSGYSVSYAIYVKDSLVSAEDISVTYKSISGEILENTLYPNILELVDGGVKYYCFICHDIPIYEMLSVQEITVKGANGGMLTGKYTLGAYVEKHGDSEAADLVKAMYAYAKSSYQYKISTEK